MMEAIQIGPAVFGPLPPGAGGGHGNTVARGISGLQDIFVKTKNVGMAAREGAQNTLTDIQEFKWGDIFMTFSYQRKGDKFLANGRPIEDINDPTEIGGDRMGRVITALNQMAADKNIDEAIVVSEDLGYGRHFIYRYRKEENGDIEGLAFEYQGEAEELGSVVGELGSRAVNKAEIRNDSIDFSVPLFFTDENKNSEIDLARAASNSFNSGERRRDMKKYLDRLNRDTEGFDELMHRRKIQEEELAKQFEEIILSNPDAKAGIAAAVYGAIDLARKMEFQEDRRREEAQPVIGVKTPEDIDEKRNKVRLSESILPLLAHGIIAIPGLIDSTGRLIDNEKIRVFSEDKEDIGLQKAETVLPVIPAIIGLTAAIVENADFNRSINQSAKDEGSKLGGVNEAEFMTETVIVNLDAKLFWQGFVFTMFEPVNQEMKNSDEESNEILSQESIFAEAFVGFMSIIHADEMDEVSTGMSRPLLTEAHKDQEMLVTSFQEGLELIAKLIESYESETEVSQQEENVQQKVLEDEIVTLGKELCGVLIADPNKFTDIRAEDTKFHIDPLGRIAFLFHVYEDPNSGELVKSFVAALIYKQIQQLKENKLDFRENPEIAEIFGKFDQLSPFISFMDERFNLLLSILQKFYPAIDSDDEDLMCKLIFIICQMIKFTRKDTAIIDERQELFSFEKLKTAGFSNMANFFLRRSKNSKRKKYGIIYQYARYLSQAVNV